MLSLFICSAWVETVFCKPHVQNISYAAQHEDKAARLVEQAEVEEAYRY
jgi:hypothetical protein